MGAKPGLGICFIFEPVVIYIRHMWHPEHSAPSGSWMPWKQKRLTVCQVLAHKLIYSCCWFSWGCYLAGKDLYWSWCDLNGQPVWPTNNKGKQHNSPPRRGKQLDSTYNRTTANCFVVIHQLFRPIEREAGSNLDVCVHALTDAFTVWSFLTPQPVYFGWLFLSI